MDATLRQTDLWRSVKKFFWDGLSGSVDLHFDRILTSPNNNPDIWVCVLLEQISPKTVSSAYVPIYMFSRHDDEGDNLYALRDMVFELLYPEHITLFDTSKDPWEEAGGIIVKIESQSKMIYNPDRTKMIYFSSKLLWGALC